MGQQLTRPGAVPANKVRALDLVAELEREYSKDHWRKAVEAAKLRWLLDGGKVEKARVGVCGKRSKGGYYLTED